MAEPEGPTELDASHCAGLLPRRDPTSHKYDFGRVVVVAGSLDYAGAAYLAALGAARAGAGLVAMALPDSLRPVMAGRLPEAVLTPLPENSAGVLDPEAAVEAIKGREPDALVVGPGLSETDESRAVVLALLAQAGPPAVVDASALNILGASGVWWESCRRDVVLTPHAGEFARLMGASAGQTDEERTQSARQASRRFAQVVLLKGAHTVIADPAGRLAIAPFANPVLATAGSGDVLSGIIGGLLAQGLGTFEAACLAVYLHGRAGERLSERQGDAGVLASEIAHEIPAARRELAEHPR